jgi:hypothetical protein
VLGFALCRDLVPRRYIGIRICRARNDPAEY